MAEMSTKEAAEKLEYAKHAIEYAESILRKVAEGEAAILPCKVGDTVYAVSEGKIIQCEVTQFVVNKEGLAWVRLFSTDDRMADYRYESFCKAVFLTREAAETARRTLMDGKDSSDVSTT